MTLFSSVATLFQVCRYTWELTYNHFKTAIEVFYDLLRGNPAAFEEPIKRAHEELVRPRFTQPGGPVNPLYVIKMGRAITRHEDGLLITASFKVSLPQEARVYGYCYFASRSETPFPVPPEFAEILDECLSNRAEDPGASPEEAQALYNTLLKYFSVSQRTFHVSWSLSIVGPFLVEKDLLLPPGQYTVYGQVLLPGWAIYNHVYKEIHSPLYDSDYYVLSCALSVAGTRDSQDVRAEAVQTVTIRELKEA